MELIRRVEVILQSLLLKPQETLEQEKAPPQKNNDFLLTTDPLFSHGMTPATLMQIQ